MPLTILTDQQASEYVASLNLAPGTEAYRTINALMLLSPAVFAQAISALAGGLLGMGDFRTLPAMNDALVERLIAGALGESDPQTLAWRYRTEWLPASIDLPAFKAGALGAATRAVAARFHDFWSYVVSPRYDFLAVDETAFHTYSEAHIAYMISMSEHAVVDAVSAFWTLRAQLASAAPEAFHADPAACPVAAAVSRITSEPIFLERQGAGRQVDPVLLFLLSRSYSGVSHASLERFLSEDALPAMAATADPARSGAPGAAALLGSIAWTPPQPTDLAWNFDRQCLARVFLPRAYGSLVSDQAALAEDDGVRLALTLYFNQAREALAISREVAAAALARPAVEYRATPGSPVGLLLAISNA